MSGDFRRIDGLGCERSHTDGTERIRKFFGVTSETRYGRGPRKTEGGLTGPQRGPPTETHRTTRREESP